MAALEPKVGFSVYFLFTYTLREISRETPIPRERGATIRQSLRNCLEGGPCSTLDISGMIGIREREVEAHLEHLKRSIEAGGQR